MKISIFAFLFIGVFSFGLSVAFIVSFLIATINVKLTPLDMTGTTNIVTAFSVFGILALKIAEFLISSYRNR